MELDKNLAVMLLAGVGVTSGVTGGGVALSQESDLDKLEAKVEAVEKSHQDQKVDYVRVTERHAAAIDAQKTAIDAQNASIERLARAVEGLSRQSD